MKRKWCISIGIVIMFLLVIYFLYPRPLSRFIEKEGSFMVFGIDSDVPYESVFQGYYIDSEDEAFNQLRACLSGYYYHPNLRTALVSNTDSYLYGKRITIKYEWKEGGETKLITLVIRDVGYIEINDRPYRVGYWGNGKSEQLMERVEEILADHASAE